MCKIHLLLVLLLLIVQNDSFVDVYCLFVNSTVRSTAFTTKDIVVSGSDDRTVKVCSFHCLHCVSDQIQICTIYKNYQNQKLRDAYYMYPTKNSDLYVLDELYIMCTALSGFSGTEEDDLQDYAQIVGNLNFVPFDFPSGISGIFV